MDNKFIECFLKVSPQIRHSRNSKLVKNSCFSLLDLVQIRFVKGMLQMVHLQTKVLLIVLYFNKYQF